MCLKLILNTFLHNQKIYYIPKLNILICNSKFKMIFVGMILSAPIWGFLFDTLGRRKLLIGGYLLDALFVFMSAFTQSVIPLMICKFFGGLM